MAQDFQFPLWDQGWGPKNALKLDHHIPYTPFSKTDRVGKIADWVSPADESVETARKTDEYKGRRKIGAQIEAFGTEFTSTFSYQISATEEADFSIVDRGPVAKTKSKGAAKGAAPVASWGKSFKSNAFSQSKKTFRGQPEKNFRVRDSSIKIEPEWEQIEELDFVRLSSLYFEVDDPVDVGFYGSLGYIDNSFDKLSVKTEINCVGSGTSIPNQTSSQDPILKKLESESSKNSVIITDTILAFLMASTRSVYSWDVAISKKGNKLVFDKRENSPLGSFLSLDLKDLLSVNENATETPTDDKESMNSSVALSMEATFVDRVFKNQVVCPTENVEFKESIPWTCPVPMLYRYRKWNLGNDISLFVRTHIDAALHCPGSASTLGISEKFKSTYPQKDTQLVSLSTLLEFDCRVSNTPDWRQKLDSTRGAVLATEFKNNGFRLTLQATEAILAGADLLKLGFLSRKNPKDRRRHGILAIQTMKPDDLASQLNFNIYSGWGIVKTLIDFLLTQPDGDFVLIKSPCKPEDIFKMALYALQKQLKSILRLLTIDLVSHPITGTTISLENDDIFKWEIGIFGPPGTIYSGGYFKAMLTFPLDFPFSPPSFTFVNPIFHPNIYPDGKLCISILHPPGDDPLSGESASERWNPTQTVESILLSVISLLADPNTSSPANVDAGVMYRNDYESFVKIVQEQVLQSQSQVPPNLKIPLSEEEWTTTFNPKSPESNLEEDNFWQEEDESDQDC